MIYPHDFEEKIGFGEIRRLLKEKCLSSVGSELVDSITMSSNYLVINEQLKQIIEFRRIEAGMDSFPLQYLYDVREGISRLRVEGTYLEAEEVFNLRRSLDTINQCVTFLNRREGAEDAPYSYPTLQQLTEGILSFSDIVKLVQDTSNNLVGFMNMLVPLLITLMLATGSITTSGLAEPLILFTVNFVGNIIQNVIIPFVLILTSLVVISKLSDKVQIDKISKSLKSRNNMASRNYFNYICRCSILRRNFSK